MLYIVFIKRLKSLGGDFISYYATRREKCVGFGRLLSFRASFMGYDLDSIAHYCGVTRRQVIRWIKEEQFPHYSNCFRIVQLLDLEPDTAKRYFDVDISY